MIDIDEAVDYILGDDKEPAPKKTTEKTTEKPTLTLKGMIIEGLNGMYYIDGESVRLERKQAYVNFDNKGEFINWIKEFEAVYEIAEKGLCLTKTK